MSVEERLQRSRKLTTRPVPSHAARDTPESRYWRSFKFPTMVKLPGAVVDVCFASQSPYNYAVCSGTQVEVYNKQHQEVVSNMSHFGEPVKCAALRSDSQMIAVGGHDESIQIINVGQKGVLRKLQGHHGIVSSVRFHPNKTQIVSASQDHTVRLWDVPTGEEVSCYSKHTDHVREVEMSPVSENVWYSASYDQKVYGWDIREKKPVIKIEQGAPVECLALLARGATVAAAGENEIKLWDVLTGGRLVQTVSNHQKAITKLCLDGSRTRLLSASLDHHVKVYETENFNVVHSIRYAAPILSMGVSPDNTHVVVGMSEGTMSVRRRAVPVEETVVMQQTKRRLYGGTVRHRMRGQNRKPTDEDFVVEQPRRVKLQKYEALLNRFRFADALDAVLETRNPVLVVSMVRELQHRNGLVRAIEGRTATDLEPLLMFVMTHITSTKYAKHVMVVAEVILDAYAEVVGQSEEFDDLLTKLHAKLHREVELQQAMLGMQGMLEMLLSSAAVVDVGIEGGVLEDAALGGGDELDSGSDSHGAENVVNDSESAEDSDAMDAEDYDDSDRD